MQRGWGSQHTACRPPLEPTAAGNLVQTLCCCLLLLAAHHHQNKPLISLVVMVAAHGLTQELFEQHKHVMPRLAALPKPVVTLASNSLVRPGAHMLLWQQQHPRAPPCVCVSVGGCWRRMNARQT